MGPADLHDYLQLLEAAGCLTRIQVEVDPDLELATITDRVAFSSGGGPALLFEKVRGTRLPVATNLFATMERLALAVGVASWGRLQERLGQELAATGEAEPGKALAKLSGAALWQPAIAPQAAWMQTSGTLADLPWIRSWPGDGGCYLTLPQVYSRHPASGTLNCGMYRVQLHGADRATIRFRPGSDGAAHLAAWHASGQAMPVAIALGGPPVMTWLAGTPLPPAVSESAFAGYLCRQAQAMSRCCCSDLHVPALAEVVIEGVIAPGATGREGPFGNHTGSYDHEKQAPLLQVLAVHRRHDAIFPWTLVGPPPRENVIMARAAAALLLPLVQMAVPAVRQLHMPDVGIFHRVAIVSLAADETRPLATVATELWATALLRGSRLLVLAADDHDAHNPQEVFWRVLNRVVWERDLLVADGRLAIDARRMPEATVAAAPLVLAKVLERWSEYQIGVDP